MRKTNLILIIIVAIFICGLAFRGKVSGEEFNSEKWKKANLSLEENMTLRWDMMNSLRNNYTLIGMSKSEIIHLLGKPDDNFSTEKDFRYYLGYSKSGIDTGSLTVKFENGRVTGSEVWQG